MHKPNISAFFPLFNEENNIEDLVKTADAVLGRLANNYEIILVDDGSQDRTHPIASELSRTYSKIKIVCHRKNLGYGVALASGFRNCRYELVFFSDGDNQFDLNELELLLSRVNEADAVIGYRKERRDSLYRQVNAAGWNFLVNLLFGLKVKDINCAFKLFKGSILERIGIDNLKSKGAMVNTEILAKLRKINAKIVQVPVKHHPRKFGVQTGASLKVILSAFKELLVLFSRLR